MTTMLAAGLRIRGLTKSYGPVRAVDGVDLDIVAGETVALLGPNGAGKSTTIDALLGLSRPDTGEVAVFGRPPADAVRAGLVGAMLQSGGLISEVSVRELVELATSLYPGADAGRRGRVRRPGRAARPRPAGRGRAGHRDQGGRRRPDRPVHAALRALLAAEPAVRDVEVAGADLEAASGVFNTVQQVGNGLALGLIVASAGLWTARSADPADVLARAAGYRFAFLAAAALVLAGIAAALRLPGRTRTGDRPSGQDAVGAQAQ